MTRVAYLTGTYPRATDTFIQREVAAHREAGWEVLTYAVRQPQLAELPSAFQRAERERTEYLLADLGALIGDAVRAAAVWPSRVPRVAALAWRTRRRGWRGTLLQGAYLVEASALAWRLRTRHVTHLHNHIAEASGTVAMLSAALGDHTYSFTLHGPGIFFDAVSWQLGEKLRRAVFCACISHFARAQGAIFAPERFAGMEIVHCGVSPSHYRVRNHAARGRTVISVGRLDRVKGYLVLLETVARLAREGVNLRLVLVGDGPDRATITRRAGELGLSDTVLFAGSRSPEDVAELLGCADVFVLPSFAEGVPVSLMEAMATGLPVIATQVGGVAELVEDGISGYVVPPGDVVSLAERLQKLLDNPELRDRMGARGRSRVERDFDSADQARVLRQLFPTCVRSPSRYP